MSHNQGVQNAHTPQCYSGITGKIQIPVLSCYLHSYIRQPVWLPEFDLAEQELPSFPYKPALPYPSLSELMAQSVAHIQAFRVTLKCSVSISKPQRYSEHPAVFFPMCAPHQPMSHI